MSRAARNNWNGYREGDRISPEADAILAKMARMRTRGLLEETAYRVDIPLAAIIESAYVQGFEDAGVAAIRMASAKTPHEEFRHNTEKP